MHSKTSIEKIGEHEINVKTFGTERTRISLLLRIGNNSEKLPPMLIFKGKLDKNKQKKLQSHPLLINKKIFTICQDNSWADHQCFMARRNFFQTH